MKTVNKAQATLEFTLVFVIMVALLIGLLSLWMWSSNNIVKRQVKYNTTRQIAGSSSPGTDYGYSAPPIEEKQLYLFNK